jgi:hypothetical protein
MGGGTFGGEVSTATSIFSHFALVFPKIINDRESTRIENRFFFMVPPAVI